MRKITQEMVACFYSGIQKTKGNTSVVVDGNMTYMYLHGNQIASYNISNGEVTIWDGGWQTTTTKERLNGIIKRLDNYINQSDWVWYINEWHTSDKKEFKSGYMVGIV